MDGKALLPERSQASRADVFAAARPLSREFALTSSACAASQALLDRCNGSIPQLETRPHRLLRGTEVPAIPAHGIDRGVSKRQLCEGESHNATTVLPYSIPESM
jgi:hypothetical protein